MRWIDGVPTTSGRYFLALQGQGGVLSFETARVYDGYHPRHLTACCEQFDGDLVAYIESLTGADLAHARAPFFYVDYLESGRRGKALRGEWVVAHCRVFMPAYPSPPLSRAVCPPLSPKETA